MCVCVSFCKCKDSDDVGIPPHLIGTALSL